MHIKICIYDFFYTTVVIIACIRVTEINNKKTECQKENIIKKMFVIDHCLGKLHGAEALGLERGTTTPYL